jgi:hypothetical protein
MESEEMRAVGQGMNSLFYLFLSLLLIGTIARAEQVTPAELDAFVVRAGSIQGLELVQEEYFELLRRYYGPKFRRDSFNVVLRQLIDIVRKVPELDVVIDTLNDLKRNPEKFLEGLSLSAPIPRELRTRLRRFLAGGKAYFARNSYRRAISK